MSQHKTHAHENLHKTHPAVTQWLGRANRHLLRRAAGEFNEPWEFAQVIVHERLVSGLLIAVIRLRCNHRETDGSLGKGWCIVDAVSMIPPKRCDREKHETKAMIRGLNTGATAALRAAALFGAGDDLSNTACKHHIT